MGALNGLGWCRLLNGSLDEVIPLAEQATRLSPLDSHIGSRYHLIGTVHLLQSRTDEAIVWLEKGRNAMPTVTAQLRLLEAAGCERDDIFSEQVSSVQERAQLTAAVRSLRKSDTLVVTKLDRFARSLSGAIRVEAEITRRGATLQVLDPNIDTGTPIGRLLFNMISSIARFEREIMLEREGPFFRIRSSNGGA